MNELIKLFARTTVDGIEMDFYFRSGMREPRIFYYCPYTIKEGRPLRNTLYTIVHISDQTAW
jgi:hypothetical protein